MEVKVAHDRYTKQVVSYLLQRLEHYHGLVILATNNKGNLDPAFIRRFSYAVEFPLPNEKETGKVLGGKFLNRFFVHNFWHNNGLHLIEGQCGEFCTLGAFFKVMIKSISPVQTSPSVGETGR